MLEEEGGESKISTKEISSITEIKEAFVVMFSPAQGILFPKSKVSDPQLLKECLKRIAADNKLPYKEEMDWRWR